MPVLINNLKANGFFKIRIQLGEAFDADDPEEKELAEAWGEAYIELRELTAQELAEFQDNVTAFMDRLQDVIVGHNFYQDEDGKKLASREQVADEVRRSSTVYNYVMGEWVKHLPLAKRSADSSVRLQKT